MARAGLEGRTLKEARKRGSLSPERGPTEGVLTQKGYTHIHTHTHTFTHTHTHVHTHTDTHTYIHTYTYNIP